MVCRVNDLADHFHYLQLNDPVIDLLDACTKRMPDVEFILESALAKALPKMAIEEVFTSLTTIAAFVSASENELPYQFFKALSRISSYFFSSDP